MHRIACREAQMALIGTYIVPDGVMILVWFLAIRFGHTEVIMMVVALQATWSEPTVTGSGDSFITICSESVAEN